VSAPPPISSSDVAISLSASSPVTGNTGWVEGPPDPPPASPPEPAVGVAVGTVDGGVDVARGAGGDVVEGGVVLDGALDPDGSAPGRNVEGESECDASRMATLSSATVSVTRRLNRITSTRNALVCTVLLHHAWPLRPQIAGGESRRGYPR